MNNYTYIITFLLLLFSCESRKNDFTYKVYDDGKIFFEDSHIKSLAFLEQEILLAGDKYTLSVDASENKEYIGHGIVFYGKFYPEKELKHQFQYTSDTDGDGLTDGVITNKGNVYRINWNFEDESNPSVIVETVKKQESEQPYRKIEQAR